MRWVTSRTDVGGAAGRPAATIPSAQRFLKWIYLARVTLAIVVFVAAAFYFQVVSRETILILAVAALASVIASALSVWHTHIRGIEPGMTFLYAQALFDLALVTTMVHVTEGPDSQFPALYILVIGASAVLMPLASSLLITALASLLYLADIIWWHPVQMSVAVWLQIAVFVAVFVASGLIASRVRVVGVEHETLQKEVRRLELEAGDILRNIRSGIVTVDGEGDLLYANPAAQDLLGLFGFDFVGKPLADVLGDRSPELVNAITTTQQTGRRMLRAEGLVQLEDRQFPIGLTTTVLERDDKENGAPPVTAIFTDISTHKRIQELKERTERLEALAELSASLAHEIKNPLASIRSSVEQLSRSTRADDDERFLAQLVVRESDRLSRLLSEFLDFARVRVTKSRPLDLGAVAKAAVDIVQKHPNCPLGADIRVAGEPTSIEGDEDLLHRVVVNLVLNAVQAAGDSVDVTVEVRSAQPSDLPPGIPLDHPVLLRVTDDGPGIPTELEDRLFDPFVTGRVGGSGLGLAIVQRAVQAHDGVVLVDSTPGEGTTFSVLLPAKGTREVAA